MKRWLLMVFKKVAAIGLIIFIYWFIFIYALPHNADLQLSKAILVTSSLGKTQNLSVPLEAINQHDLELRRRAASESFYNQTKFAADEVVKDIKLTQQSFKLPAYFGIFGQRYKDVSASLDQTNQLLASLQPIYQELEAPFDYSQKVSYALRDFYYYDPRVDQQSLLPSHDPAEAPNRYFATSQGLKKTAARLMETPDFANSTAKQWIPKINDLSKAALDVGSAAEAGKPNASELASDFSAQVMTLQNQILQANQNFWDLYPKRQELLNVLQQTQIKLIKQTTELSQVRQKFIRK